MQSVQYASECNFDIICISVYVHQVGCISMSTQVPHWGSIGGPLGGPSGVH